MPAYFDTGFSVREPMWHGQGLVLDEYPTDWADARTKAGLTWEPKELNAYVMWSLSDFTCPTCFGKLGALHLNECGFDGTIGSEILPVESILTPDGVFVRSTDHKAIVRADTGLVMGFRSDEYSTIYHGSEDEFGNVVRAADGRASMQEIIEAFTAADDAVRFETAGSCREGRQVWCLLYLDEPFSVPGDSSEHLMFVAVTNNHAGGACKVTRTSVRVVCWNTYQAAEAQGERSGMQFTFRHVGDVAGRMDDAVATIKGLRTDRDEYIAMAAELSAIKVDDDGLDEYLSEFLPSPRENGEVCSDTVHGNVTKARSMFKHIYLDSATCEGITGTGYGLLQASTEYLDHARRYLSQDTYMGRSILGREPAKERALLTIRGMAK